MADNDPRPPLATCYDFVVVGAGPAGVAACRELAKEAGSSTMLLIGGEPSLPYERPPLSKDFLHSADAELPRICSLEELEEMGVVFRSGIDVTAVDPDAKLLSTDLGPVRYGSLLLATGSSARRFNVPGGELPQVHYLRTEADGVRLRSQLLLAKHLVVIGAGFIGLELAATARSLGCGVEVVTNEASVLMRCLPIEVGRKVIELHERNGLRFHFDAGVEAIEGDCQVTGVRLSSGLVLKADLVVVGIGSVPNTQLAESLGATLDNGITVDSNWRTNVQHVFATGDVACRRPAGASPDSKGVRLESWEPAIEQGRLAAAAMLGRASDEPEAPWMWSDQGDLNIQIIGNPDPRSPYILRAGRYDDGMIAAFVSDDKLTGAITLSEGASMAFLRRALSEGSRVESQQLADPEIPLRTALGMGRRSR